MPLANRSEGVANRSEELTGRPAGLANRSEGMVGWAGLGPVDKSGGLGARLAWALSING